MRPRVLLQCPALSSLGLLGRPLPASAATASRPRSRPGPWQNKSPSSGLSLPTGHWLQLQFHVPRWQCQSSLAPCLARGPSLHSIPFLRATLTECPSRRCPDTTTVQLPTPGPAMFGQHPVQQGPSDSLAPGAAKAHGCFLEGGLHGAQISPSNTFSEPQKQTRSHLPTIFSH